VYKSLIREPYHIFGGAEFNDLNKRKAEEVHYLLFKDSKYRLGLTAARKENKLISPFSAPFGGFSFIHEDVRIKAIEEAVMLTEDWCKEKGMNAIRYTLPPPIYHESFLAKVANVMYRQLYTIENVEINFHFDLSKFTTDYIQNIWHNARKNLNIALAGNLSFVKCTTVEQIETAYKVIQRNREVRGKPLRMTHEQLVATGSVVPSDFFLVSSVEEQLLAAAIVFTVAPRVAQVIYWGDIPEHSQLKTMNYLSFKVFEFYKQKNFRAVDIGYSTEDSVPNYGLCEFKESLGCDLQPKLTYTKSI
jgi:hypothetical protein